MDFFFWNPNTVLVLLLILKIIHNQLITLRTSLLRSEGSVIWSVISFPLDSIPPPLLTSFVLCPQYSQTVAIMTTSLKWGISVNEKDNKNYYILFFLKNIWRDNYTFFSRSLIVSSVDLHRIMTVFGGCDTSTDTTPTKNESAQ